MRLHGTALDELIRIFTTYGGHRGESKLMDELAKIDFTVYEQQTGLKNNVLVFTKHYNQKLNS
jgi:hypothetical protein